MFFPTDPQMSVDLVAIVKTDHGYQISISKGNATMAYSIESEDSVLDLVAELITGRFDAFAKSKIETPVH